MSSLFHPLFTWNLSNKASATWNIYKCPDYLANMFYVCNYLEGLCFSLSYFHSKQISNILSVLKKLLHQQTNQSTN